VPWCGAGLMGAIIGSVWNYGVSSIIVWSRHLSPHAKKCILAIGDVGPARARGLCIRLADRL